MPFALLTIGMVLIITGFQNTYKEFGAQVAGDFTGQGNFLYWFVAIMVVGALGYNKTLQPFSRAFLLLIMVGIFLSNKGFFSQINGAISSGSSTNVLPAGGVQSGGASSAQTGGVPSLDLGNIGQDVQIASDVAALF